MTGRMKREPDPADPGRKDYRDTENIGERDGRDPLVETEETVDPHLDADGDGRPEPTIGSSDDVSRDVKTELDKARLRRP